MLTKGLSITLPNGTVIKPEDVITPSEPSNGFIFNYIPNESYVKSMLENSKYKKYFKNMTSKDRKIKAIYHSTDDLNIFKNVDYLNFMKDFGDEPVHIIDCKLLNSKVWGRPTALELALTYQSWWERLYPIAEKVDFDYKSLYINEISENLKNFNYILSESELKCTLFPESKTNMFNYTEVKSNGSIFNDALRQKREFIKSEVVKKAQDSNEELKDFDIDNYLPERKFKNEPEILFLGTISMKPGLQRSASAIYVNIPGRQECK